ncbi:WD-REPEATS-REGION domain-containing protein [Mycena indigotica]|uniref:WD-REPEATS-REGION domain-containing protein n=1 Tax=Mycena indigotica TaxID=2126181 RepID=A0A8H6W362_9AGAR|nr:WD-REPEATS-REGION domain-containing protein [Mycena indigotica]KAF7301216.1 WD-REPEATS-REGION domain-containing protein [Mycena indigotica]
MNAAFFFNIGHPTTVQTSLVALASFARFDPSGRYVATGRIDGSAAIWDLETRSAIRILDGHVKAVSSLDWSRHSRFVLTTSKDWNVIIWDLANRCIPAQRHSTLRFDAPVVSASFHPRNSQIILALLTTGEAFIVDQRKAHRSRVELCEMLDESDEEAGGSSARVRSAITIARFDPSGKHVYMGTTNGQILVFNTRTKTMVARYKITGAGALKGLEFTQNGRYLVSNSADRTLRQFTVPVHPIPAPDSQFIDQELEPMHRFNDPINKTAWHAMSYSPDGEWLAGGKPTESFCCFFDDSNGALDGGREPLMHLHWHPSKSAIASTTNHGNILIWHRPHPERWGAFAGGFEELDENVEYQEREDEFDIEDEADMIRRKMKEEEQEVDVDTVVVTKPRHGQLHGVVTEDEDLVWAEEDPDEDVEEWIMQPVMEEDWDS